MGHARELRRCYDAELARDHELKGGITMTWWITPQGTVRDAAVAGSTMQSPNVESCIVAELQSWTFPTSEGPTHVRAYPFKFGTTSH
jgi:hypothetical protein